MLTERNEKTSMLRGLFSAKRLFSLTVSLVLILSLTLLCAPAVFAVEHTVDDEAQFLTAYESASAGDTITLSSGITLTQDITLNKNIHIDCNDFFLFVQSTATISSGSITGNAAYVIYVDDGGELRIQQNASISGGNTATIEVSSGALLTMSRGTLTGASCVINISGGTVALSGGTITTANYGVYVVSGGLEMSGGTIISTGNSSCYGVIVAGGTAVFTGGNIGTEYGVTVRGGEVTTSVPVQQLSGFYYMQGDPMITSSPAAITMQRGQTRTVTLNQEDNSFSLYLYNTSPELNAEDAGLRSATIRPLQAGSYILSFHTMIGEEEAFVTLNIPVTVTNPSSSSSSSDSSSSDTEAELPQPKPTIPETGAGNLLFLLLQYLFDI